MAGSVAKNSVIRPNESAANPIRRIAIEMGWPLES